MIYSCAIRIYNLHVTKQNVLGHREGIIHMYKVRLNLGLGQLRDENIKSYQVSKEYRVPVATV